MTADSRQILKSSNHRWMSLFFFAGAILSFYQLKNSATLLKLSLVSGGCLLVGIYFLLKKSQDFLWIESEKLCFTEERGAKMHRRKIPIKEIKKVHLEFSGARLSKVIMHRCLVEMNDQSKIELPNGIVYSAYNPEHASMKFLMNPLREINPEIKLVIDDQVTGVREDFSNIR